jgi:uncharacterized repeat protein (TIGR01451 family)
LECLEQRLAPANIPPTARDNTAATFANVPVQIDILSNDSDPDDFIDPTTVSITHAPANGSVNLTGAFTGYVSYTPDFGFTGTDSFRYTVKDSGGAVSNEATVTVTIRPDLPPVAVNDTATAYSGAPVTIDVLANDTEADDGIDPTTVQVVGGPGHGTASLEFDTQGNITGNIIYTSNTGFVGTDTFQYNVADAVGGQVSNTATVTVTVRANQPPVAVNDTATVFEGAPTPIHVLANDTEPDDGINPASVLVVTSPGHGSASPDFSGNGDIIYTPNAGFTGTDTFTYDVADFGGVVSNRATVTVTVQSNQAPVAVNDSVTTVTNLQTTIDVLANDTEPDDGIDPASVFVVGNPAHGSAVTDGLGNVLYTSNFGFTGTDTFTYDVADLGGFVSNVATVTVTVGPQIAPTFVNLSSPTVSAGTPYINVSGQLNSNVGGQFITFETVDITLQGVTITATLDPTDNFAVVFQTLTLAAGTYPITFNYSGDSSFLSTTATSTLTVVAQSTNGTATFSNLSSPTITYGTSTTTISGHLGGSPNLAGSVFQLAGSPWAGIGADINPNLPSIIFTLNPDGSITTTRTPNFANPFDSIEDTYIGVVNPAGTGLALNSLDLVGADLFGFEADGIATFNDPFTLGWFGYGGAFPGGQPLPGGPTTYEGPGTFFNYRDTLTLSSGTVNFQDNATGLGLLPGQQAFFSLENTPTAVVNGNLSAAASAIIPAGEPVQITINGVTQTAFLDSNDDFSTTFDTSMLGVAGSPYTITFDYAGDPNFDPTSATSMLTVDRATPTITSIGGRFLFDGQPHPATGSVTGVFGEDLGAPTFTYIDSSGNSSSSPPVNIDTYTVVASYAGSTNYLPATDSSATIVIFSAGPPTDLGITATDSGPATEGGNIVYNITIANSGPADATNVILTDVLPTGTSFVSANFSGATVTFNNGVVTVAIPALSVGTSAMGTIDLAVPEEGTVSNTLTVTADNSDPNPSNNSQTVMTDVSDPAVLLSPTSVSASEASQDLVVATFTDPGGLELLSDYSADIDWGDGQSSLGTITLDSDTGVFSVHGTHAYAEEGSASIQVTIHHDSAPDASVISPASILDPAVIAIGDVIISGTEGSDTGPVTVATFTDPGGAEAMSDYSADIAWGDGQTSSGEISFAGGVFTVQGSHTYVDENTAYIITITIHHDFAPDAIVLSRAEISDPAVIATGGFAISGTEGLDTGNVTVATFTDPGGAETLSDYSADIAWGDGLTSSGSISFAGGMFTVTAGHTYAEETSGSRYPITVTIHHDTAPDATATSTAFIIDPSVLATGGFIIPATEGLSTGPVTVASFTDPGGTEAVGDYSANIAWGDGQSSTGVISLSGGMFTVTGSHTYTEEKPVYSIAVTIFHDLALPAFATSTAQVSDPSVSPTGNFTVAATENSDSGVQTVATFTDPGGPETLSDYSADINWGDGQSSTGSISFSAGVFTVQGSHRYVEEDSYTIAVTIHHDTALDATTTSTAIVSDPAVNAGGGFSVTGTEGADTGSVVVATFTDPAGAEALSEYSADINWEPGQTTAGTITFSAGVFTVRGNHVYVGEGDIPIVVTVHHGTAPDATATDTAEITDPPVIAVGGFTLNAVEGTTSDLQTVATFADPGGVEALSDYSADISWGDGSSSAGTITVSGGIFSVSGSHSYAEEGTAPITVSIHHALALDVEVTSSASISDAAVNAKGSTFQATEATPFTDQAVATFTDPGGAEALSDYSASIDWGDLTSSAGRISFDSITGVFTVSGDHTFAEEGPYTVRVTIHHDTAADVTATGSAQVVDAPVDATGGFSITAVEGVTSSLQTVATFTDPVGAETLADYSATIDWGDSTSSAGQISVAGGTFAVAGGHLYAEEGPYVVSVTINHDTATAVTVTSTADITDQDVIATGSFAFSAVEGTLSPTQTVATFTDPAGAEPVTNYSARIAWGDGSTSAGNISFNSTTGVFSVQGDHIYPEEGRQVITVTIMHETAVNVAVTSTATIQDASLFVSGQDLSIPEGSSLATTIASFTDGNPNARLSDFTATILWGDGSSSTGQIVQSGGSFLVQGSHVYAEDGVYTATVTVRDLGGSVSPANTVITVTEPAITTIGVGSVSGFEFTALSNLSIATFTHAGGVELATDFRVTINWGDGASSAGTVTQWGTTYTAFGSHIYTDEGNYSIRVSISDDTATATLQVTATMLEELLPDGSRGTTDERWLSEIYRELLGRRIDVLGLTNAAAALSHGVSRQQIVLGIENSLEYRVEFVNNMYFALLGRAVDPIGLDVGLRILGGVPFLGGRPTIEQLEALIFSSPEYFQKHGSTNAGFLAGLYHDALGRDIEPTALSAWSAALAAGATRNSVALAVLDSAEAAGVLVERDYRSILNRDADAVGLNNYAHALLAGMRDEDLLASLAASDEFYSRTVP